MVNNIKNPRGGRNLIQNIEVDRIQVPDLRVTSTVDDHIMDELRESIRANGILQPLRVARVGDDYIVVDGLHRLIVARELGMTTVPCIVRDATEQELIIQNLILNRQRGRSNPVHEAQVIAYLIDTENMTIQQVSELCSLSPGWVSRLYKIAALPREVLDLIEVGSLSVSAAEHLTKLQDPQLQIQVAHDAVNWRYTEEQVRIRVNDLLNIRPEPGPGDTVFDSGGKPTVIPITCNFCHTEVQRGDGYIWICDRCRELIDQFWQSYISHEVPPTAPPTPVVSYRRVLTSRGWE